MKLPNTDKIRIWNKIIDLCGYRLIDQVYNESGRVIIPAKLESLITGDIINDRDLILTFRRYSPQGLNYEFLREDNKLVSLQLLYLDPLEESFEDQEELWYLIGETKSDPVYISVSIYETEPLTAPWKILDSIELLTQSIDDIYNN